MDTLQFSEQEVEQLRDWGLDLSAWRPIQGFPGFAVSRTGQVLTFRANQRTGNFLLRLTLNERGYHEVGIVDESGAYHLRSIPILVASAFVSNPRRLSCVRHLNGNITDNRPENLQWAAKDASRLCSKLARAKGERHPHAKLTEKQVREMRARAAQGVSPERLAAAYAVSRDHVWRIVTRCAWTHL